MPVIVWLYGGSLIAGSDVSYPHLENLALPPGRLVANFLRLRGGVRLAVIWGASFGPRACSEPQQGRAQGPSLPAGAPACRARARELRETCTRSFGLVCFDACAQALLEDVVLVVPQYRLGAHGFLSHAALDQDDPRGVSGNYGTLGRLRAVAQRTAGEGARPMRWCRLSDSRRFAREVLGSIPGALDSASLRHPL